MSRVAVDCSIFTRFAALKHTQHILYQVFVLWAAGPSRYRSSALYLAEVKEFPLWGVNQSEIRGSTQVKTCIYALFFDGQFTDLVVFGTSVNFDN